MLTMCIIVDKSVHNNGALEKPAQKRSPLAVCVNGLPVGPQGGTLDEAVAEVAGWLRFLVAHDSVAELGALKVSDYRPVTKSGFFDADRVEEMAREALQLTSIAEGVYFTLNPVNQALL